MSALEGLTVLDFSTLLPGPLAGLILAEAGATIIKVERPSGGDEMRSYHPRIDDDSVNFLMLNRVQQPHHARPLALVWLPVIDIDCPANTHILYQFTPTNDRSIYTLTHTCPSRALCCQPFFLS